MGGWMTDWSSGGLGVEWVDGGVLLLFFSSCFCFSFPVLTHMKNVSV